jgi:hypothetical protein
LTDEERKRGNQFTAGEQAVKNAKKGRAGRTKADRERKAMADFAQMIAFSPIQSETAKEQMKKMGLKKPEDLVNQALVVAAIFNAARKGNMVAVEKWQELTDAVLKIQDEAKEDELTKSLKEMGEILESDD